MKYIFRWSNKSCFKMFSYFFIFITLQLLPESSPGPKPRFVLGTGYLAVIYCVSPTDWCSSAHHWQQQVVWTASKTGYSHRAVWLPPTPQKKTVHAITVTVHPFVSCAREKMQQCFKLQCSEENHQHIKEPRTSVVWNCSSKRSCLVGEGEVMSGRAPTENKSNMQSCLCGVLVW